MSYQYRDPYTGPPQPAFIPTLEGPLEILVPPSGQVLHNVEAKAQARIDIDTDDALVDGLIQRATAYCEEQITQHRQFLTTVYNLPTFDWWMKPIRFPRAPLRQVLSVNYYDTGGVLQVLSTTNYVVRTPWRGPGSIERAPNQWWPSYQYDRRLPIGIQFLAGYVTVLAAAGNVITAPGLSPNAGDLVRFSNSGGALPAPLAPLTNYYVVNPAGSTFEVALTSGGSAITLTDTGSGFSYVGELPQNLRHAVLMLAAHWYENREAFAAGAPSMEVGASVSALLNQQEYGGYA